MLEVNGLNSFYGEHQALFDVSIRVKQGEVVGIIGNNGSGKTTLLKAIMGLISERRGEIWFENRLIGDFSPHDIVRLGITYIPSEKGIFPQMDVYENLIMGTLVYTSKERAKRSIKEIFEKFPIFRERRKQLAGRLSGGEQKLLSTLRGILMKPKLLLIDEPSAGLGPKVVSNIYNTLREIRESHISVLIVEQDTRRILKYIGRGYLLENGQIVLEGEASDLIENEHVKKIYLGL